MILDKDFASNQTLYISYAHTDGEQNYLRVISAKLAADNLELGHINHAAIGDFQVGDDRQG